MKNAFKFRWTSLLFYITLCVIIAAGIIAVLALQKPLTEYLADYEANYETDKPKNQIQRIFERYFENPDIDEWIALSDDKPEYHAPDTYEDAVKRYADKVIGKKITYGYLAGSGQKTLNVKADGNVVARFSVKTTGEKTKYDQDVYVLDKVNLYFDKPTEYVNVILPERFTAYADGVPFDESTLTSSGVKDDVRESVPEGAYLFTYKSYAMSGLFDMPVITVKNERGEEVKLDYDEEKRLYSCKYEYSEELKAEYSEYVIEALTMYCRIMQADAKNSDIKPYVDNDSQLCKDILNNPHSFPWEHDYWRVENEETSEFYDYGDAISCRVKLDHVIGGREGWTGENEYVDHVDFTVYMHKVGEKYLIYYWVNNNS